MLLNLGCGDRYADGWHNVDRPECPHRKDEAVDLTKALPWPKDSVVYAYAGHLLEHLTKTECRRLLKRLLVCMAPGGQLVVVGPDVPKARAMAETGTLEVPLDQLLHGGHRWPGDEHRWECDPATVVEMLTAAGWVDVTEVDFGGVPASWPIADRGPRWQFAVSALRAGA